MIFDENFLELIDSAKHAESEGEVEIVCSVADIKSIGEYIECLVNEGFLRLVIDGNSKPSLNDIYEDDKAQVNATLYKTRIINSEWDVDGLSCSLFITWGGARKWLESQTSPFNKEHCFYKNEKIVIFSRDIIEPKIGTRLALLPLGFDKEDFFFENEDVGFPEDQQIKSHVHFITSFSALTYPENFFLPSYDLEKPEQEIIFKWYRDLLIGCLVKEFYSRKRVILSGIKRVELSLSDDADTLPSLEDIQSLVDAVNWVYQEKSETRLLLILDRLTLDVNEESSLASQIFKCIPNALEQAKCRYEFVIVDRKEAHARELSELQKDLSVATESYSRSSSEIVTSLTRDSLSVVFSVFAVLFSKFFLNEDGVPPQIFDWVFYLLACYLLISGAFRIWISVKANELLEKNIVHWKVATRNHMSSTEFDKHYRKVVRPYKKFFSKTRWIAALMYLAAILLTIMIPKCAQSFKESEHNNPDKDMSKIAEIKKDGVPFYKIELGAPDRCEFFSTPDCKINSLKRTKGSY